MKYTLIFNVDSITVAILEMFQNCVNQARTKSKRLQITGLC